MQRAIYTALAFAVLIAAAVLAGCTGVRAEETEEFIGRFGGPGAVLPWSTGTGRERERLGEDYIAVTAVNGPSTAGTTARSSGLR